MKICIIGAGLVGVTSAYYLAKAGHKVVMVDKEAAPAQITSNANGGQLSYSYSNPLAGPCIISRMPKLLLGLDKSFSIKLNADIGFYKWLLSFINNCRPSKHDANNKAILKLGLYSRQLMHELLKEHTINFDYLQNGKIQIYRKQKDLDTAIKHSHTQNKYGCNQQALTPAQAVKQEPALKPLQNEIIGAIYSPLDESGDAYKFTTQLADICKQSGVEFIYNKNISIKANNSKVVVADIPADNYIICAGSPTRFIAKQVGISVPIYPMKGYSLTAKATTQAPKTSITDNDKKIVYTKMGNNMRVAGIAQLVGYNMDIHTKRCEHVINSAAQDFGHCYNASDIDLWAGLRPQTPSSVPIISATKYSNLYLNCGQGMLGWTLCLGSAKLMADIISGANSQINAKQYDLGR